MKKAGKRVIAFLLALIMVVSIMPASEPVQAATKKVAVKKVTTNYTQYVMKKGQKLQLKATISPKNAKTTLKWKTSNKKVATVSSKGVVTAKAKKGKATITVTAGKKKATCKITIGTPVKKITASNMLLTVGKTAKIKTTISPKTATVKTLTYKSSNTSVVKVYKSGKILARKAGKAKITITAADCGKVKKTITVTVKKKTTPTKPTVPDNQPSDTTKPTVPDNQPSDDDSSDDDSTDETPKNYTITIYDGDSYLGAEAHSEGFILKDTSAPYVDGKIFLGWYYDSACTKKVQDEDTLSKDITLYGNYGTALPLSEDGSPNYISSMDEASDFTITVDAHSFTATKENVAAALLLTNVTDPSRTNDSAALQKDELTVSSLGEGKFAVSAKDGFQEGATYQLEILANENVPDMTFDGQKKEIVCYNFTIKKDEVLNLSLDTGIKYLSVSELTEEDAEKILAYTGLYQAEVDSETGETTYTPTNNFGTFTYQKGAYLAGDIIAVYQGEKPDERDLNSSLDEGVSYIEITLVEGTTYSYKSAKATDVLFTPDIIPVDIDEGDGVTDWNQEEKNFYIQNSLLDFTTGYEDVGLDFTTVVEPGDYVAFYSGEYGAEDAVINSYGKIILVVALDETTKITYEDATYEEVMASMDIYNESDLSEEQLDSLDEQLIVATATKQVLESGFAEEAGMYLATFAVETDEVQDMLGESDLEIKDCILTYEDGTPVPTDEVMLMAKEYSGAPEVNVKVSKNLVHFEEGTGFRVEIALKYNFDVQKQGNPNKVSVELTAIFETEVLLKFSASGGAVWKKAWIFPYIYDYQMSGSIDNGLYSGIAVTATAQLSADDEVFGPELLEPEGLEDYGRKLVDLSESIKQKMEENKKAESEGTASGGLVEKYKRFIDRASDTWIDLVSVPLFEASGSLDPYYVTAYSVNIDFVISANMTVAIGMSFQYENYQRYSFTLMLFHRNESSSRTLNLKDERFQFDFYVMGTLGIRAGIRGKVLFGLFSTKLAGVGVQLEAGAYARLWGYFYYCLSWQKGKNIESSATGALLIEIGAYLELNLAVEVLNGTFSYTPSLYSNEWPIWSVGEQNNVLEFAYDENGSSIDSSWKGVDVPKSFDMVREKKMKVPAEIFRMKYLDLKEGTEGFDSYDGKSRSSYNSSSSAYDDELNFFVETSDPAFVYNPIDNTITVNPEKGKYSYEGTMTITWKKPDGVYASKTLSRTFELTWVDPDAGKCLVYDTKGGTKIRTKVYEPGIEIPEKDKPQDPSKVGYAFGGWYLDEECTQKTTIPKIMPDHDVKLYAKWIPIPNEYTVRFYVEQLNTKYKLVEKKLQQYNGDGTRVYTDDPLSQDKIVSDNFLNDEGVIPHGFEVNKDLTTVQSSVAPDGSTVVDIYYKRQIHSVLYSLGELKDDENPDTTIRYRYEESLVMPTYFMPGYEFSGWDRECLATMDVEDLTYTAQWTPNPNTPYYIEYYIRKPGSDSYVMLGGENGKLYKEGETGTEIPVSDYMLDDVGYTLDIIKVNGIPVSQGGSGKIDGYGKLLIQYYYTGEVYDISYDTGKGELVDSEHVAKHYTHGFNLSLDEIKAEREGYNFIGWLEDEEAINEISLFRVGDINLTAEWRASKKDIYLYDEDGSTSLGTVTATYDQVIPSLSKLPTKNGYDFAGYYDEDGTCYYDEFGDGKVLWEGNRDISLKASWTPANVEISYDANGGEGDTLSREETYLSKYPEFPTVTKAGYHLLGWTIEGDTESNYITADTVMNKYEPHTLVAQWEADEDTTYHVALYLETSENTAEYELHTTQELSGTTDTTVSVDENDYKIPGYIFELDNEAAVLSDTIRGDGSTVLKLYYKQGTGHRITYNYGYDIPSKDEVALSGTSVYLPYCDTPVDNMRFTGWTDGSVFYKCGAEVAVEDSDLEFTAVWEEVLICGRICYSQNNGDGLPAKVYQDMFYDTSYEIMENMYTKAPVTDEETGEYTKYYEFAGWNTQQDGTGKWYYPGDELLNKSSSDFDVEWNDYGILYAQWREKDVQEGMVPYYVAYEIEDEYGMYRQEYIMTLFGKEGDEAKATKIDFQKQTFESMEKKTIGTGDAAQGADNYDYLGEYTVVVVKYSRDRYTLKLDYNGGQIDGQNSLSEEVRCGADLSLTVSAIEKNPEKAGYKFVGWDVNIPTYMPTHNITAVAQYKIDNTRPVTVEYYTENLDGKGYTLASTDLVYGEKETEITPKPMEYIGFKTPEAKPITVSEDGSAVCKYYYDRCEYTLSWNAGAGELSGEGYTKGSVKYGAPITAPTLTRSGYDGSWIGLADTMPAQNITYKAEWTAQLVGYDIVYRKQSINGEYTVFYSRHSEAKAGTVLKIKNELPEEEAAKIEEGYRQPLEQIAVIEDASTVIYMDYTLYRSYLNYDFAGGAPTSGNYAAPGNYYYGQTLQLPPLSQVKRLGYTVVGWYDAGDPNQTILTGTMITMGDEDVTYRLKWEPVAYNITYDLVEEDATNPNNPNQYQVGSDFNISGAVCEGMAFVGWEWIGAGEIPDGVVMLENGLVHITKTATGDISLRAVWSTDTKLFHAALYDEQNAPVYLCEYPVKKAYTITLEEITPPEREGYVFSYWTKKIPKEDYGYYTIILRPEVKVSSLNLNSDFVTANWLKIEEVDGKKVIVVESEREFRIALEYLKAKPEFKGIKIAKDFAIATLRSEPLADVWEADYSLYGNNKTITLESNSISLFNENRGNIYGLNVTGEVNNRSGQTESEENYYGVITKKNYGLISGCSINGYQNEDRRTVRSSVRGVSTYFGGIAGYNEGIIKNCTVDKTNIIWSNDETSKNGTTFGNIGGIVGYNDANGLIYGCNVKNATVSLKSCDPAYLNQKLYMGGIAGVNPGKIQKCNVTSTTVEGTFNETSELKTGYICVGGIAGIDAEYVSDEAAESNKSDIVVGGIYQSVVENTNVQSEHVAGGVIGECNYGLVELCSVRCGKVYGEHQYAGQIIAIYRSKNSNYSHYRNFVTKGTVVTVDGIADIIALRTQYSTGESESAGSICIQLNDMNTKVIQDGTTTKMKRGSMFYGWAHGREIISFVDGSHLDYPWTDDLNYD